MAGNSKSGTKRKVRNELAVLRGRHAVKSELQDIQCLRALFLQQTNFQTDVQKPT
jgi:hypothetical protein